MKKLMTLFVIAALISLTACSGAGSFSQQLGAQSSPPADGLQCSPAQVFRGQDNGRGAFGVYTTCLLQANAPDGGYNADVTYTLAHSMPVANFTSWLGTAQNSIEETAGELEVILPDSTTALIVPNQKDKHTDVEGERIEHASQTGTYTLPAGTQLVMHMNLGIHGYTKSCSLGCAVQLNIYLNPPASSL